MNCWLLTIIIKDRNSKHSILFSWSKNFSQFPFYYLLNRLLHDFWSLPLRTFLSPFTPVLRSVPFFFLFFPSKESRLLWGCYYTILGTNFPASSAFVFPEHNRHISRTYQAGPQISSSEEICQDWEMKDRSKKWKAFFELALFRFRVRAFFEPKIIEFGRLTYPFSEDIQKCLRWDHT